MTKSQIHTVLDRVHSWPEARQAEAARMLEALEQAGTTLYTLSDAELAAIDLGLAEADAGEFVPDDDMAAFWNRHRPQP